MDFEYLPATRGARQELVLLHGWGSNREIWRPLLAAVRPWANVTLFDIPGCAPACADNASQMDEVLAQILNCAPPKAVYVGWSLGGQLAAELAARQPDRVAALVTICSTPRFVGEQNWPGMAQDTFAAFETGIAEDPVTALRRFDSLQVAGSPVARKLLRQLPRQSREGRSALSLSAGLQWLRDLDQRSVLPLLVQPQLHLLGGKDTLVPAELEGSLRSLLQGSPSARVSLLPQACHVAPLDSHKDLARQLWSFLEAVGLLRAEPDSPVRLAKAEVAQSFSRAAIHYDSVAKLQRDVGTRLLSSLQDMRREPSVVLDLGCGTGYFQPELQRRYPQADYIGLDLAQGMVEYARTRCSGAASWLVGDAEALPLAANSVDLVFSSLAIQWCDNPQLLFAELSRVLRPGGRCVFTSLGPGTLCELRSAWAAVDAHQHVNTFLPLATLETAAEKVPGIALDMECVQFRMEYQRVRDLLDELKTLGAHNMNRDRPSGLTSRRALQGMLQAYERWRQDGRLPATYDVIFGVLEAV